MKGLKSKYEQTKVADEPLVKELTSVQDIFSIISIDESGMYEIGICDDQIAVCDMIRQRVADFLLKRDIEKCIVQLRGVRPFLSNKFDLTKHPNYPLTSDYSKKNWFDVEKFLKQKLVLKADDQYEVIEVNE